MFVRYYLELGEATRKDLLDQLGHAISLSQPDPAARIDP